MPKEKREEVKDKIDKALSKQDEPKEDKDKPTTFSLFGKKISGDMQLYLSNLDGAIPTRAVSTKFRNDIEEKMEKSKEKDELIKFFNKKFKIPGVSTLPWNYFSESVMDPTANDYPQVLDAMEKKYGHLPAWRTMIDGERKRLKEKKADNVNERN